MSEAFESIRRGLKQAIAHQQGRGTARVHHIEDIDVQALRTRLNLTQEEFAARFGIRLGTLRHWERGDRKPRGTALVLLHVIDRAPRAVLRALS
ncbi:MAG: helix-turn-helix domain-containing protein [Burkholderiales bacterium]|nr:helix-turn-helix domain-containing protein [Burkholderiales bacterium]